MAVGRDFNQLIVLDVVDGLLERESARRGEDDVFIASGGADVGELLAFGDVDDEVVVAAIFADDHPFVDLIAGRDKEDAAVLQVEAGVAVGFAGADGDQNAA